MKKNYFNKNKKTLFYAVSLFNRLLVLKNVKKGKISMFFAEIIWIINGVLKAQFKNPSFLSRDYYETKYGKFFTEKDLTNTIIASPAFENPDKEYLIKLISREVKKRKKILFIDVGAHIGVYSISIANKFKRYQKLDIIAFEPDSQMFSMNSFKLLKKNVKINKIKNIKMFNFGLGDRDGINKIGIKTKRLDDILSVRKIKKYDTVFMKIDIEGFERFALRGAKNSISQAKNLVLLIEDCVDMEILSLLEKEFTFLNKITPFNGFWKKNK